MVRNAVVAVLFHGMMKRCSQCGNGKLHARWITLERECPQCGCKFERRGGHTWFFTHRTTAFLAGVIVLWMFLYLTTNHLFGQIIAVLGWFAIIVLTLPYRKGFAVAIDYILEERSNIMLHSQNNQ